MQIEISKEEARGCGYRHSGKDGVGLYLMGDGNFEICERLPFPVDRCPCCGEGISFGRGFTWITPEKLFGPQRLPQCYLDSSDPIRIGCNHSHDKCFVCSPPAGKHGLLWVGEKFYSTGSFLQEAVTRGISKRISSLPRGFVIGETVVYLAHKKAFGPPGEQLARPGVFTVFRPNRLDIVVDVTDPSELPKRAISISKKVEVDAFRFVKVEPVYKQDSLFIN
jgi:hypothetical protein